MRKQILKLGGLPLLAVLLAACGGSLAPGSPTPREPTSPATVPAPISEVPPSPGPADARAPTADAPAMTGPVYVDEAELLLLESYPVQVRLVLRGALPNPCSEFRWEADAPDDQGRIQVRAYSLQESELNCIQVLQPLEEVIPLGAFTQGSFSVWVNGELIGEFEL